MFDEVANALINCFEDWLATPVYGYFLAARAVFSGYSPASIASALHCGINFWCIPAMLCERARNLSRLVFDEGDGIFALPAMFFIIEAFFLSKLSLKDKS